MIKIPLHSSKKLLLAFEFGLHIADVAKQNNVELTPEIIKRVEKMMLEEWETHKAQFIANNWSALLLAAFEPN